MQLITTNQLAELTRFSRSTLWRLKKRYPDFPQPVQVGTAPRWVLEEVETWLLEHRQPFQEGKA